MSLPGSSKGASSNGEGTILTTMLIVATLFLVAGTIFLSIMLKDRYDKFLWNW